LLTEHIKGKQLDKMSSAALSNMDIKAIREQILGIQDLCLDTRIAWPTIDTHNFIMPRDKPGWIVAYNFFEY